MKLIICSDYVIEQSRLLKESSNNFVDCVKFRGSVEVYSRFLKRPLELGMFIPADKEGNVLEWKEPYEDGNILNNRQYQEAKDRVLFKGVMISYDEVGNGETAFVIYLKDTLICSYYKFAKYNFKTIEDLCELGLELTESAIKQLKV